MDYIIRPLVALQVPKQFPIWQLTSLDDWVRSVDLGWVHGLMLPSKNILGG